jgi:hypothetical protein
MKKDEQVSAMVECLHELRDRNRGERIRDSVVRWIEDPLKPKTKEGKFRVNPILLLLAAMALVATGTCVFFSLVQL